MYNFNDLFNFDRQQAAIFLVDTVKNGELKLMHPTKSIVTYCRQSSRYRKANILLFSDENLQNQWYLVQIYNLVDGYICDGDVFNPLGAGELSELHKILQDTNNLFDLKSANTKVDGFLFSQERPYHYIYDQFVSYFYLSEIDDINQYAFTDKLCFYKELPDNKELLTANQNGCYLFPCTKGSIYNDKSANSMHHFIRSNSAKIESKSSLTLWVGITAQKRSWLEQTDGLCNIAIELSKHYSSITVLVDGWTSLAGGIPDSIKDIARDNAVFDAISTKLSSHDKVELVNLIGKDYKYKVGYALSADAYIANSGAGSMVPLMFASKKGVLHSNGQLYTFENAYDQRTILVPKNKIYSEKKSKDSGIYSIDWKVIYNLLANSLGIDEKLTEVTGHRSKHYFNIKKFIFKKSIQIETFLKKVKSKIS